MEAAAGGRPLRQSRQVLILRLRYQHTDLEIFDATVDAVVDDLLRGGPAALAASKRLLAEVPSMGLDEAFAWTQELSAELFAGPEAAEGMAAYLEKRPAPWIPTADTPEL